MLIKSLLKTFFMAFPVFCLSICTITDSLNLSIIIGNLIITIYGFFYCNDRIFILKEKWIQFIIKSCISSSFLFLGHYFWLVKVIESSKGFFFLIGLLFYCLACLLHLKWANLTFKNIPARWLFDLAKEALDSGKDVSKHGITVEVNYQDSNADYVFDIIWRYASKEKEKEKDVWIKFKWNNPTGGFFIYSYGERNTVFPQSLKKFFEKNQKILSSDFFPDRLIT